MATFKHTKFTESEVMMEFEFAAREKGEFAPNVNEVIKNASINKKSVLESTGNLVDDVVALANSLRSCGFEKEACELENNVFTYKRAQSDLYKELETGEELLNSAHPEGDVAMVDKAKDDGHIVETLLTQHKKIVEVATKEPKVSKAAQKILSNAFDALGLYKSGQERTGVTTVEHVNFADKFTPEQKAKIDEYMKRGVSFEDAIRSVTPLNFNAFKEIAKTIGSWFAVGNQKNMDVQNQQRAMIGLPPLPGGTPQEDQSLKKNEISNVSTSSQLTNKTEAALNNFKVSQSWLGELYNILANKAKGGTDKTSENRSKIAKYLYVTATGYVNTLTDAIANKNTIDELRQTLNGQITFNTEDDLVNWSDKFKKDTISEYNRVLKEKNANFNIDLVKLADQGIISLDTPAEKIGDKSAPTTPVQPKVQTQKTQPAANQPQQNSEVKQAVVDMQDLLNSLGLQLLNNHDRYPQLQTLAEALRHTGVGAPGDSFSADGKWGPNTKAALDAFNKIADIFKSPNVITGPFSGKGIDPKQVLNAANANLQNIAAIMRKFSFNLPGKIQEKNNKAFGDLLDKLPSKLGVEIVDVPESEGTISLYSKDVTGLSDFYYFLVGNGLMTPSKNEAQSTSSNGIVDPWANKDDGIVSEGLSVGDWDLVFRRFYNRADRQLAAAHKDGGDDAVQNTKLKYKSAIVNLYKTYKTTRDAILKRGGGSKSIVSVDDLGMNENTVENSAPSKENPNAKNVSYQNQGDQGFEGARNSNGSGNLPISDFINLHELADYAQTSDKFGKIQVPHISLRDLDRASPKDLMNYVMRNFPDRIGSGEGKTGWKEVAYNFLNDLETTLLTAYRHWTETVKNAPEQQAKTNYALLGRWTTAVDELKNTLAGK